LAQPRRSAGSGSRLSDGPPTQHVAAICDLALVAGGEAQYERVDRAVARGRASTDLSRAYSAAPANGGFWRGMAKDEKHTRVARSDRLMGSIFTTGEAAAAVPVWFVNAATYREVRERLDAPARAFAEAARFEPKAGKTLLLPGGPGIGSVLFGVEALPEPKDPFLPGLLPQSLPDGVYRFANDPHDKRLAALAFALGAYRFARYRKAEPRRLKLDLPQELDRSDLDRVVEAVNLGRDLVNTPANDLGPAELEAAARGLAAQHGAEITVVCGDELLAQNFPLIHAVGRASTRAPRLIAMQWGDEAAPRVALVGKGVCFDSGGLDIKPENAMLLMKKDMGGAASALALAQMIMDRKLKVRLSVLIPAVENAISGAAFRPRDIYPSRKGLSIEIGNTDAEGRLILADALALADESMPEMLIDMGTLTGAARVALGPDVPPFYTADDALAAALAHHAAAENDPLWRLPLWPPYEARLESKVADLNNVGSDNFAGSIICALFLQRFVERAKAWLHIDLYAWNPASRPGRPEGGECQAARALYSLLVERYG
jgi:leucyl aminopeptidase